MELLLKVSIQLSIFAMCIYELSECWIWTCLNVKEFLAWNKRRIGNLFDCWFGLAKLLSVRFWTNWFWVGTQLQSLINLPLNPLKTTGQNSIPRKMFKLLINIPRQLTDILNPNLDGHFRVSFFDGAENSKSISIWDLLELSNWFETSQDQKILWRTESCIWCYMAS